MKKFIDNYSPEKLYVLNENIDETIEYKQTKVEFTNHLNIFEILDNV